MKKQSENPYKFFKYTDLEKELNNLISQESSIKVMEKFVEYGIPPVGALAKEAEDIYISKCEINPSLNNKQHEFNKFFGYLVGQELEKRGYRKTGSRGKVKGRFFKTGTKFTKIHERKNVIAESENPFSKIAGIVKIGDMSNEEIDNVVYA